MNFIFTIDYELFGDGSGNVFKHMIEPTEKIIKLFDQFNIKTTIFFEVIEYMKIKEEWEKGNSMGYKKNPVEAIEKQLREAAINGHDIQLHIHPQWVDAKFVNQKWKVDFSNWRLGSFSNTGEYDIERLLKTGKKTIENLIRPVLPDYECIALRAGAYNIMPSDRVYTAMKKTGLLIDSSVFPGGYENGKLSKYDYRQIQHDLDFWWANPKDITRESSQECEILEIPVFALKIPRWRKVFNLQRLKSAISSKTSVSALSKSKFSNMSKVDKIKYLLEKESFTWDFSLLDSRLHKRYLKYIDKNLLEKRQYFVLIAHPKSSFNEKACKFLLKSLEERNGNFRTISYLYEEIFTKNTVNVRA
jgi:hypothetical protein